jgi:hypothetical protein
MPEQPHSFKRLVLGLQPGAPDRTMQFAVELADLLHLDLLGLFLDDTGLRDLASMPFAREFRPLGGGWHTIDLDRLSHDFELVARNIERMFTEAAKRLPTRSQFEVVRGPLAKTFASLSPTDDIVMIVEPVSAAERATQQFARLMQAAFQSTAAVMLVPPQIARTKGPVVAIAAMPDDPSIYAAATIATAAREELVVIETQGVAFPDPAICAQAFRQTQERLVVMTRGAFDDGTASAIAAARRVPVLVIEPLVSDETSATQSRPPRSIR